MSIPAQREANRRRALEMGALVVAEFVERGRAGRSIAEFYSQNLATEVMKGMRQKAIQGGTPGRAPLGYLNERRFDDGREVRTITVDSERAEHVVWAFNAYATGEWSVTAWPPNWKLGA